MSTPEQFRAAQSAVLARDVMIHELRAELAAAVSEKRAAEAGRDRAETELRRLKGRGLMGGSSDILYGDTVGMHHVKKGDSHGF